LILRELLENWDLTLRAFSQRCGQLCPVPGTARPL